MNNNLTEPATINNESKHSKIFKDGLWRNNPALIQLLGLCPLLAVTTSFVNGFALGLATCFVLIMSNLCVSLTAPFIPASVRLPIYVLIIASLVTSVELIIQAFYFGLYSNLGIFLPLIVTNCTILGRAEAFAAKNPPGVAILDGLYQGSGFGLILILMGSIREVLGSGKLFSDLYTLGIQNFDGINIYGYDGFLLLILPPGGFILLGVLIAMKNIINERTEKRKQQLLPETQMAIGSKRVRVSG